MMKKVTFFQDLNEHLEIYQREKIILAGDFSYVEKEGDRFSKSNKNDVKKKKKKKKKKNDSNQAILI